MKSPNLHDEFIDAISHKVPKRSLLTSMVSDILHIEKDSAYRRLSGKVSFSAQEIGAISLKLGISLDSLMHSNGEDLRMTIQLNQPLQMSSVDMLAYHMDATLQLTENAAAGGSCVSGNIVNAMPLEFFMHSPVMTKLMFFKWGHYFVSTGEFDNYSSWEVPPQLAAFHERVKKMPRFESIYYIWDESLVWVHANEIANLHKMRIITTDEKNEIKQAFKDILVDIENTLNGSYDSLTNISHDMDFYVSSRTMGFVCGYYISPQQSHAFFQTNFSFSIIDDNQESYKKLKNWADSFKNISTMLSKSGRVQRRIFFDNQHKLIDFVLGYD